MENLYQPDENNQMFSENEDMMAEICHRKVCDWSNLPDVAIENIYTHLNTTEKINLSLVCKNFLKQFNHQGLWSNFKVYLHDRSKTKEVWPEVKLAKKFGFMFSQVEIIGQPINKFAVMKTYYQLQLLLQSLEGSKAKLTSLKFINLREILQHLIEIEHTNLLYLTLNFIKTQNTLVTVTFHNSYYKIEHGIKILKALCNYCNNLNHLILIGFTENRAINNENESYSNRIYNVLALQIMKLKSLEISYSLLFENILRSLKDLFYLQNHPCKSLSQLKIYCDGSKNHKFQGIPALSWKILQKICPSLKVQMSFFYSSHLKESLELYLVESMPLVKLEIKVEKLYQKTITLEYFLQRLVSTKINASIEDLSITYMSQSYDISAPLIPFLKSCPKLKRFDIVLRQPVRGLRTFFESILYRHSFTLKHVHVTIVRINTLAYHHGVTALAGEYRPLFQDVGLDVTLTPKMA